MQSWRLWAMAARSAASQVVVIFFEQILCTHLESASILVDVDWPGPREARPEFPVCKTAALWTARSIVSGIRVHCPQYLWHSWRPCAGFVSYMASIALSGISLSKIYHCWKSVSLIMHLEHPDEISSGRQAGALYLCIQNDWSCACAE